MKSRLITSVAAALFSISFLAAPVHAADGATTVNVALLDMSSVMGSGMMGQGMMGPGWGMTGPGQGMMGPGWGMMGPGQGMMGPGWGMMGMSMMSIRLDHSTVKAGNIHFAVTNWSRAMVHEMLAVAVENPNAPLPYDYGAAKVPEEQVKALGEVDKLKANESGSLDIDLAPGTYLLICNVEGHYAAGMVTALTVTP